MNDTPTPRTDERKASFALDTIRQLETELTAVTEQRDRLAELLSEYMTKVPLGNQPHMLALKADEALQSLTTKEQ